MARNGQADLGVQDLDRREHGSQSKDDPASLKSQHRLAKAQLGMGDWNKASVGLRLSCSAVLRDLTSGDLGLVSRHVEHAQMNSCGTVATSLGAPFLLSLDDFLHRRLQQ